MDQELIVEPDDRRTWTPLRVLLLVLAAVAGGILLSLALGGPARADTAGPASQPPAAAPAPSADTSLVGRLSGTLADVTQTALAPVDEVVATVAPRTTTQPAAHPVVAPATAPASAAPASTPTIPATLDHVLALVPLSATPLWQSVVGSQPVEDVVSPLAIVLRPLAPGAANLIGPVPSTVATPPTTSPSSDAVAIVPGPANRPDPVALLARGLAAPPAPAVATAPSPDRHVDAPPPSPTTPLAPTGDVLTAAAGGGAVAIAVLSALVAAALLALTAVRRRGWILPAAPAFGADVSPD